MTASFEPDVGRDRRSGLSVSFFGFGFVTKQLGVLPGGPPALPSLWRDRTAVCDDDVRSGGASHLGSDVR